MWLYNIFKYEKFKNDNKGIDQLLILETQRLIFHIFKIYYDDTKYAYNVLYRFHFDTKWKNRIIF